MLGISREELGPRQQHVAQRRRQIVVVDAAIADGAEEFLNEQRDPLGAFRHELDQIGVGSLPEDRLDLSGDVALLEAIEFEPLDDPLLLPAGCHPAEGMGAMELVGPHAQHEQQPAGAGPRDEQREQVERRAVRPLKVLEHEHQRSARGQPRDHTEHQLEQPRCIAFAHGRGRLVILELGYQASDLPSRGA